MVLRRRHTFSLLLTLLPFSALAEESLQVNVLVFAQPDHGVSFELWRPTNEVHREYPLQRIDFKGIQAEIDDRYTDLDLLPSDRLTLASQRLQENDYRVLVTQSWVQPILAADDAMAVVIKGGQTLGNVQELEGYLTVYYSERRVRLGTHLWLSRSDSGTSGDTTQFPPGSDQTRYAGAPDSNDDAHLPVQAVQLNDTRLLNVGDLHYIDHPRFGMLVELVPLAGNSDTPEQNDSTDSADQSQTPAP